jgi:hypothetical protein
MVKAQSETIFWYQSEYDPRSSRGFRHFYKRASFLINHSRGTVWYTGHGAFSMRPDIVWLAKYRVVSNGNSTKHAGRCIAAMATTTFTHLSLEALFEDNREVPLKPADRAYFTLSRSRS